MSLNKLFYLVILILAIQGCRTKSDRNISEFFTQDESRFHVDTLDYQTKQLLDSIWNKPYDRSEYEAYIETLDILLTKGYLNTAAELSQKVDYRVESLPRRTRFFNVLGKIYMYQEKPDSAINCFRYVYFQYPIAPQYSGHNKLHFYNDAVMSLIEAGRCNDAEIYFDSLKMVVSEYPDSLFYIGNETRLHEFDEYIDEICKD